ncbi:MAG TPA: cystathionine beta-synthase [Acidimicrobiales bacterium]
MLPPRLDVLLVVEPSRAPHLLAARARRVVQVPARETSPSLIGELRGIIPGLVGVVGDTSLTVQIARQVHQAGFPTVLFTDETVAVPDGVEVHPVTDPGPPMQVADSVLGLVGDTPLVRFDRIGRDLPCHLLAKLEYLNPGGSVKDRPAVAMLDTAEAEGLLGPGGTIVEPTSGNTGVGLAMVAAQRGYRCIFTMPDKIAEEKRQLLRAFGAEVVVCPTAVAPEHPESYYSVANRIAAETPGAFQPNQYQNPRNPDAHEASTGPEIWQQTAGRITHFVAGVGTGGTISGVGRYLKAQNPSIQVVAADPEGSIYSGGGGRPYLVEGIGEDFWPGTYDRRVVDRVVPVSDRDSFLTARRVTREEGILVGGSTGTAVWAALQLGQTLGPHDVVVVLVPDSGRGYLSKLYDDGWMADHGFVRAQGATAGAVLSTKADRLPSLVHVHPDETVRTTIAILDEYGVSQVPVVKAEPPLALAEVVGSVTDRLLLERTLHHPEAFDQPVGSVMEPPLATVGQGETVDAVAERLQAFPAVLVLDAGHPVGILTRSDLLSFLEQT